MGISLRQFCLAAGLLFLATQPSLASTWTFGSGGTYYFNTGSSYGNRVTFTQGSERLVAKAWSNTGDAPAGSFEASYVRRFSAGIGVCNPDEGSITSCITSGLEHQVDNVSQQDLVLFLFDSVQAMDFLTVDPSNGSWDRDVSFWVGTVAPTMSLGGLGFGDLASLGFGSQVDAPNSPGSGPVTIGLGGRVGNALLVGALNPGDASPDRFKIRSLVTSSAVVPVPAAGWLFLSALASVAGLRRLAR